MKSYLSFSLYLWEQSIHYALDTDILWRSRWNLANLMIVERCLYWTKKCTLHYIIVFELHDKTKIISLEMFKKLHISCKIYIFLLYSHPCVINILKKKHFFMWPKLLYIQKKKKKNGSVLEIDFF